MGNALGGITSQVATVAVALGFGHKYKYEAIIGGTVSLSYMYEGRKYLMTIQPYPYER